ncbi:MAG: helix-turn-helix transcriptional regulator [Candidatus Omnitrophica bacterium]|nr:helix-turn-helix transcriptional regulator [Candidatus Omnitrophota bacterium]
MTLGERIKALRKIKGLTQRELAKKVNVNYTYISKIENNKLKKGEGPGGKVIKNIAYTLIDKNPDILYNELMVLAGKISEDFKKKLLADKEGLIQNVFYKKPGKQDSPLFKYLRKIV